MSMEKLYYEENHHKWHETKPSEIIDELLEKDEDQNEEFHTVKEELIHEMGHRMTKKAMESALEIEKNNA